MDTCQAQRPSVPGHLQHRQPTFASRAVLLPGLALGLALVLSACDCRSNVGVRGCAPEMQVCNGQCADVTQDDVNCGACGKVCQDGTRCANSTCLPVSCSDSMACATNHVCSDGQCLARTCVGVTCETNKACVEGACVPRDCETQVCPNGYACFGGACIDAACSGVTCPLGQQCHLGACAATTCADGTQNGTETAVDCGGLCPRCADHLSCLGSADCQSGVCSNGWCLAATCSDGVKNQDESDLDCGGATCPACMTGATCRAGKDCSTQSCVDHVCAVATCTDGVVNQGETGPDCGGPHCGPCVDGLPCVVAEDCSSRVCTNGRCEPATCADGVKNQDETGLDCGGAHCPGCAPGGVCLGDADCASHRCLNHVCLAETCSDGVRNGLESDVDCGGGTCPACVSGSACRGTVDCQGGLTCVNQVCVDRTPPAAPVLVAFSPASPSSTLTPTLSGTSEPGTALTVYASADCTGAPVPNVVVLASGAFSVTATVPANALTSFSATAKDAAGNVSACSNALPYQHDGAAPAAPVLTGTTPPSPARATALVVEGLAEAGATVTLYAQPSCGGAPVGSTVAAGTGWFALPATVGPNTTTTYSAAARDAAGNVSPCSNNLAYVQDSVAPAAPTLTGTAPSSPSNSLTPTVSGQAEPGATVAVYQGAGCAGVALAGVVRDANGTFHVPTTVAANALATFTASATDAAGNVSACSPPLTYAQDSTPPAAPLWVGSTPVSPSADAQPTLAGTSESGVAVSVHASADCTGSPLTGFTTAANGAFSGRTAVTPNVTTSFTARATDPAGNASACSAVLLYRQDQLAPPAPVLTGTTPASPAAVTTPTVSGTAEADAQVTLYGLPSCAGPALATAVASAQGTVSWPVTVAANQLTTFSATARDAAGNLSTCSNALGYQHDSLPPAAPVLTATTPGSGSNVLTPTVLGTAEPGATVTVYATANCAGAPLPGVATQANGAFLVVGAARPNTTTPFTATATDAAGNTSPCSAPLTYLHDSLPPAPPTWSGSAPASPSSAQQPVVAGTAEAGAQVLVYAGGSCSGAALPGFTTQAGGAFSGTVLVAANSSASFTAVALDAAGNVSACSAVFSYTHDNAAPATPTLTGTTPASPSIVQSPLVNGVTEPGATVRLYGAAGCVGTPLATGIADGAGAFALAGAATANAITSFSARAEDAAHNLSGCSAPLDYTHDSTPPSPPLLTGSTPASPSNASTTPILSGSSEAGAVVQVYASASCSGAPLAGVATLVTGAFSVATAVGSNSTTTFTATARDAAGNLSGCSLPLVYVHDTVAPATPVLVGTTPVSPSFLSTTPTVFGTADPGSTVKVFSGAGCGGVLVGLATASLAGAFSITTPVPPGSTTVFWAQSADAAGNLSACTASSVTFTNDRGAGALAALTAGPTHTCGLLSDGTAACWGTNAWGQLGDGTSTARLLPTPVVGLAGAKLLATARRHTCAVLGTGALSCWGNNDVGQLGVVGAASQAFAGLDPGLGDVVGLAAGEDFTCALLAAGTVSCWGVNDVGQVGIGSLAFPTLPAPQPVLGVANAAEIVAGAKHACARLTNGTVKCWGQLASGVTATPVAVGGLPLVRHLAAGGDFTCATTVPGGAWCWGGNASGQLGNGGTTASATPVQVTGVPSAVDLAAGAAHACARLADSTVACWGRNDLKQLGDGSTVAARGVPGVAFGVSGVMALASGPAADATCGLSADGTARCWGANGAGQAGGGSVTTTTAPRWVTGLATRLRMRRLTPSCGDQQACGVRSDGRVVCWGANTVGPVVTITGGSGGADATTPTDLGVANAVQVVTGVRNACARTVDGKVWCWGPEAANGQLGDGNYTGRFTPVVVPGLADVVELSGGYRNYCAVKVNGDVWCWGSDSNYQLGINFGAGSKPSPVLASVGTTFPAVAAASGYSHTMLLSANGTLAGAGAQWWGQLALPTGGSYTTFTAVPAATLSNVRHLATATGASAVVLGDGTVWVFGENSSVTGWAPAVTRVGQWANVVAVSATGTTVNGGNAADATHWRLQLADGRTTSWGNVYAPGNGTMPLPSTVIPAWVAPSVDATLSSVVQATELVDGSCALTSAGAVWCWGNNERGQVGDGTKTPRAAPGAVTGFN